MQDTTKYLMLRDKPIFTHLKENELSQLAGVAIMKSVKKNNFLYHKGDQARYLYIIQKGSVKLGSETSADKILIKHLIYENEIIGENIFTGLKTRNEFAKTMSDTTVLMIPIHLIKSLTEKNADFAASLMEVIIQRLHEVEKRMHNFVFKKAKQRILDFVIRTGKERGIKIGLDECLINHGMSHKEIAFLTDTSRQTVARVLGELKRDHIIHFSPRKPGKILIRNWAMA